MQDNEHNRRQQGGVNRVKTYPCLMCGAQLESYGAHKRHISRVHGSSNKKYDQEIERILGHR
jgi:hypothetical protein